MATRSSARRRHLGARSRVFTRVVAAAPETVFDLVADLRGYHDWLPQSANFRGETEISDGPVGAGTTYVEDSPFGIRHGTVTEFDRPSRIDFHQPMTMKPAFLGSADVRVSYRFTALADGGTLVERHLVLTFLGPVRLFDALVRPQFHSEMERTLDALREAAQRADG